MKDTDNPTQARPDRIETLREKKAAIEAQIARLNAAAAKEKRRLDTHKKILVGAVILAEAEHNPRVAEWLKDQLWRGLKQPRDRAIFDMPPLPPREVTPDENAAVEREISDEPI